MADDDPQHSWLHDEYYQIGDEIFSRLPRTRPALTYFRFEESIQSIRVIAQAEEFLPRERYAELKELCEKGQLFVSRADHPVYCVHLSRQLDLVLMDTHLNEDEVAQVFFTALGERLGELFNQPLKENLDALQRDVGVLASYIWQDRRRLDALISRIERKHSLISHSVNACVIGLALFSAHTEGKYSRDILESMAAGLLLHDIGMTRIPGFVLDKEGPLHFNERKNLSRHPQDGVAMLEKLGVDNERVLQCVQDHHERLDGSGYPEATRGHAISLAGRLTGLADSFAAMISHRPHAKGMKLDEAAHKLARDPRYDTGLARKLAALVLSR